MSDSEKLVFYLIGAALCACPNALLVIEEPETLLHNSIKNQLWDEIEAIRPDCTFVYLTHDIDFATSRSDSKRIWIRSYDADHSVWDYELIESNESFQKKYIWKYLAAGNRSCLSKGPTRTVSTVSFTPSYSPIIW